MKYFLLGLVLSLCLLKTQAQAEENPPQPFDFALPQPVKRQLNDDSPMRAPEDPLYRPPHLANINGNQPFPDPAFHRDQLNRARQFDNRGPMYPPNGDFQQQQPQQNDLPQFDPRQRPNPPFRPEDIQNFEQFRQQQQQQHQRRAFEP